MNVRTMRDNVFNAEFLPLYRWIGVAVVAVLLLWLGWRTGFHHLVIALLVSATVLLVSMALLELAWWVVVYALRRMGFRVKW